MTDQWSINRTPFPVADGDDDYSGRDFRNVHVRTSSALSHAFFNGVSIQNGAFIKVALDQCEFAEAYVTGSHFIDTNLSGSDLVRANFDDVEFSNCDFTDGEWRESKFTNVRFVGCRFSHTTINLCTFFQCTFSSGSTVGLDYKAVNYNVFTKCIFEERTIQEYVLARNFGMETPHLRRSLIPSGEGVTLEQVCIASSTGRIKVIQLVDAIERECNNFQGRLRKLRLEFVSNIVSSLAAQRHISPSSLIYIEDLFTSLAKSTDEETDFRAATSALINVRNALFDQVSTLKNSIQQSLPNSGCGTARLTYQATFAVEEASSLATSISYVLFKGENYVTVSGFHTGSTFFALVFSWSVAAGSALMAFNFFLTQATISFRRLSEFKEAVEDLFRPRDAHRKSRRSGSAHKLPAIMRSGAVSPELAPVRAAVHRAGRSLVRLDDEAMVELITTPKGETMARED